MKKNTKTFKTWSTLQRIEAKKNIQKKQIVSYAHKALFAFIIFFFSTHKLTHQTNENTVPIPEAPISPQTGIAAEIVLLFECLKCA